MADDTGYFTSSSRSFLALTAFLILLSTPLLLVWLADQQVFPWRDERSWVEARRQLIPVSPERFAHFATARVELEWSCFDVCPEYRVTIWGSGLVEFEGYRRTCVLGRHTANIEPRLAVDLIADLHVSRFRELWWKPRYTIVDLPKAIIRYNLLTLSEAQEHYHGDENAPRVLFDMERTIDAVAGTSRWLPFRDGSKWVCTAKDGTRQPMYPI